MELLEQTLDCLVAAVDVNIDSVHFGFIKPQGGSIRIRITVKDGVISVSEI